VEQIVEPMYWHVMQRTVMEQVVFHHSSLHNTPVHRFYHTFYDLPATLLTVKWLRKEHSRSLIMALFCRNM
jgi:hypothetical protein